MTGCTNDVKDSSDNAHDETRLADSLAITRATLDQVQQMYAHHTTLSLKETDVNEKSVTLTFEAHSVSTQEQLEQGVKDVLMEISKHTVDSEPISDGIATVYDHYNVYIIVNDDVKEISKATIKKAEQQITWGSIIN
jgi:hypothetical protein